MIFPTEAGKIRFRTNCSEKPAFEGEKTLKNGNLQKEKRGDCSVGEKCGIGSGNRLFPQVNAFHTKEQKFLKEENAYE